MAFEHSDAQSIADLSAILPYMNEKFPFHLRKGFDQGVLRRCDARRRVHPPERDGVPMVGAVVEYVDTSGVKQKYTVEDGGVPPLGTETGATDASGNPIKLWW
jgi:hypothetical protein